MAVEKQLPQNQLDNVIRMIHSSDRGRVLSLRNATYNTLQRLQVRRDTKTAVGSMPDGSDHCDLMSIYVWLNKILPTDTDAVAQVVQIDATAVARTGR